MSISSSPAPGTSYRLRFLIPSSILLALALLTSITRLYTRCHPNCLLRWDDYTLVFALLLIIVWYAIVMTLYSYGRGVVGSAQPASIVGPLGATCGVLWFWSMNMVRISMCLMILRLKDSKRWKYPLWSLIAVQIGMIIAATSINLAYCRPLSAAWEPNPDAVCLEPWQMEVFAYTYNAFNIASDLILSLIPLAFIVKMHRRMREKILIGCLMATGLLASVFGVLRFLTLLTQFQERTMAWSETKTDILCGLEVMVAIIAASLPCLKAPTERTLRHFGLLHSSTNIDASPNSFLDEMAFGDHIRRQIEELPLAHQSDCSRGF